VIGRIDEAHGPLARPLLVNVGDQPRHPRHDEKGIGQLGRDVQIDQDRRDCPIHVDRQRAACLLSQRGGDVLDGAHPLRGDAGFFRQREQPRRARIGRVDAVPQAGDSPPAAPVGAH